MTRREALYLAFGAVLLTIMALYCVCTLRIGNDITHFLPADTDARLASLSRAIAASDLSRTMVLAVDGPDTPTAARGASALAAALRPLPEIAWLRAGVDPAAESHTYDLFFPRRLAFASEFPERELPPRLTDAGLAAAVREARAQLQSPLAPLVARLLPTDPLLTFPGHLERMRAAQGETLSLHDGQFVTRAGHHGLVLLATRHSPFDSTHQKPLLQEIATRFESMNRVHGSRLSLRMSGVNRIAVDAERRIRGDVTLLSALSSLAMAGLFLLIHQSLRYLLLAALPIAVGVLTALTLVLLLFKQVHGLTLAFGTSMIGVALDYPVYLINHHSLVPGAGSPQNSLHRVWRALLLGALTTVAGLVGMALTSFPGLREIAVFSSAGILGALAATRFLVPQLMPAVPRVHAIQRRGADALARLIRAVRQRPGASRAVLAAALLVAALGIPRARWNDDPRALSPIDLAMLREDEAVRGLLGNDAAGQFVVALGDDEEAALRLNDTVFHRLVAAQAAGSVGAFRSLHSLLWSQDLQARNLAFFTRDPGLPRRVAEAFAREGFQPTAFEDLAERWKQAPPPLTFDDLARSPVADMVRPFRLRVGLQVGMLTFVSGVRDPAALRGTLADLPSALFFDQEGFLREAHARYRRRTLTLMAVGLLGVFALLFARYRHIGRTLGAFAPSVVALVFTLGLLGLFGVEANLMHLLGMMLILSMGSDYGIFLAEASLTDNTRSDAMFSISVACLSSIFSFGILWFSEAPSLRAIGLTTALGLTASLLLAPLGQAAFNPPRSTKTP
jgi:predicted exporter